MKKEVKLYKVSFLQYTNCCNDTVSNYDEVRSIKKTIYIDIPEGGLIIREDELEYYKHFGHGFQSLQFVGTMLVPDTDSCDLPSHEDL